MPHIHLPHLDLSMLSKSRFLSTMLWAVIVSSTIVAIAAGLARATLNLKAALTDKPDIAIYLLLPEEHITKTELLREKPTERDYLAQTGSGAKLVRLKKIEGEWHVTLVEKLHE